jgi:23S rRNA (guanosine2251-2'-O)-methyltransferase
MGDTSLYVVGRRAVHEALEAGSPLAKIMIAYGAEDTALAGLRMAAKRAGVHVAVMDRRKFNELELSLGLARNDAQGVLALRSSTSSVTIDDLVDAALQQSEEPILVALDGLTDPHNVGAIARSAECAGAYGLIMPTRYSAPITPAAIKASAGALEHLPVARVNRISDTIKHLRSLGFRIVGSAVPAAAIYDDDVWQGPLLIVIGNEGEGLHPRVQELCDVVVEIPMSGKVGSLNASVAAGVILFEAARQRRKNR